MLNTASPKFGAIRVDELYKALREGGAQVRDNQTGKEFTIRSLYQEDSIPPSFQFSEREIRSVKDIASTPELHPGNPNATVYASEFVKGKSRKSFLSSQYKGASEEKLNSFFVLPQLDLIG